MINTNDITIPVITKTLDKVYKKVQNYHRKIKDLEEEIYDLRKYKKLYTEIQQKLNTDTNNNSFHDQYVSVNNNNDNNNNINNVNNNVDNKALLSKDKYGNHDNEYDKYDSGYDKYGNHDNEYDKYDSGYDKYNSGNDKYDNYDNNYNDLNYPKNKTDSADNNKNIPLDLSDDEYKLSCMLKSNEYVIIGANNLLFITIKKAISLGFDDNKILKLMKPEIIDNIYLVKSGFSDDENKKLLDIIKNNTMPTREFSDMTKDNFEKVMASLYPLTYNIEFQMKAIDNDIKLQNKVVEKFNSLFCADFNWNEIKKLLNNEGDKWLLLDILINLSNCPSSLFRRNLGNKYYIRHKHSGKNIQYNYVDYNMLGCKIDTAFNKDNKIVLGSSFYTVYDDMVFAKILRKYNRKYLAGPSGSTVLLYIHVFDILGVERTDFNNGLLLGMIISNYVPFYHTLTEILLSSSFETKRKYVMNMDPVKYVTTELKSIGIIN